MKTDPRFACPNDTERRGWAMVHDCIAHPLMALAGWSPLALRFHDWTSLKAWPRIVPPVGGLAVDIPSRMYGSIFAVQVLPDVYAAITDRGHYWEGPADDATEAAELAAAAWRVSRERTAAVIVTTR